ncbi:hypothetical protein K474DRAFT_1078266 [Panus rudis PR-1116 ss-1]|nr:hypothetical protein K474DRAFT_1078266 [Panus rudis PR-1116 ss-1]
MTSVVKRWRSSRVVSMRPYRPTSSTHLSGKTTVDDINTTQKPRRKNSLRRSRSVGDFYSVADVLEMHTPHVELESELAGMKSPAPPLGGDMHPFASPIAIAVAQKSPVFQRTHFVKKAKEVILGDDAKKMAEFRLKFSSPRPLDLSFSTLQSQSPIPSPVPSALEAVKSPRVPYWVKPKMSYPVPKTPRTMRTERRQGWGGSWELGEVVNKLKELQ